MENFTNPMFHFPQEIELEDNPLVEAWLEIKWTLEKSEFPEFLIDKTFPFALGIFNNNVKEKYPYLEELNSSKAPEGMLPYVPQYRFRTKPNDWPLLQLGPGIATVNFAKQYNWLNFKKEALYLQQELLSAYSPSNIDINSIILKYRNVYPAEYSKGELLEFLSSKLNINITLPKYIPGDIAELKIPTTANLVFNFEINDPTSIGVIRILTGKNSQKFGSVEKDTELIIWELEIIAKHEKVPSFNNDDFSNWLEKAHAVVHEWFFSMIDGDILSEFTSRKVDKK